MKILRRIFRPVEVSVDAPSVQPELDEPAPARVSHHVRLAAGRSVSPERLRSRLTVIGMVLAAGFAVTAARAVEVSLSGEVEPMPHLASTGEDVRRSMILDRDGEILASTIDFHTVYADPAYIWDAEVVVEQLATVLTDIDQSRLLARLNSGSRYVQIAEGISPRTRQAIHMLGLAGVFFESEPGRVYPKQRAAAHVVGFAGRDGQGLIGAELAFDAELQEGGAPVYLSLDLTAQHRIESVLRARMAAHQAAGASAILMRVGTGEILAMTSLPDFDPNLYLDVVAPPQGSGRIDPRYNQASRGRYELGSVFKPLALAAGLETGRVRMSDIFDASEPVRIGGHVIRDYRGEDRPLTARETILYSSNIASARMADQIGTEALIGFYRDLRLFEAPPIELAETREPQLPRRWGRVQTMTASYGHGFAVSPLALTAAYGALANGGVYVPPTVRPLAPGETVVGEPVMSSAVAAQVLGVLRENVVRSQTGSADIEGLVVAGKTGTAERVVAGGGYAEDSRFNTFVAIFPFDDPQYVLTVTLDRPRPTAQTHGFATAGWTAMPAAGEIMQQLAAVLDLDRRDADPGAQISTVEALFAPRPSVYAPIEEPVPLASEAGQ